MDGNPALVEIIRAEIQRVGGRITFERLMELALYQPQHGYYTSGTARIGRAGDYFTSVSVGPLFGKILARHFRQMRAELGEPPEFELVEFGGHRGQLRADVLAAAPELRYRIIEVGDPLPERIVGCVFSNELLDALPVHRVRVEGGAWREIYVGAASPPRPGQQNHGGDAAPTTTGEGFALAEYTGPLSTPRLAEFLRGLPVHLMEGYGTEVNLRALDWLTDVSRRLTESAYILTFDYGFEREEYFAPHHKDGHLQCYYRHQRGNDPYRHIGEQDLTAHVEFTSLMEAGRHCGLETVQFTDQGHYLLQAGEAEIAEIVARDAGRISKERSAIHQLIHPGLMGRAFRVLVQRKQQAVAFAGGGDLSSGQV